ncbi:hypothetical protein CAPTEDRAFT_199386 [Capitella teleta]|uniref:Raptor N-terminal CASPase-like domain-containing protein n=1 Tax=Capitella teleta TaxID=283909 RepID=R7V3H2_CAPTE|nr:hypothetical protein CAPTEDRAFT_199386 [Capitella teleta]|eukprot:ELU10886.1 hypothetical protein CAPTEDRAFT_199386 [Capitella teleta]
MIALGKEAEEEEGRGDDARFGDWQTPLAFVKKRHLETIEGSKMLTQTWRMKERMKTVSVALVMCLNVGVDPPDVVKISPCARMECWIDPQTLSQQKALETIGSNLQRQYERWQPRARYKQSLDPTVDEVKKLCTSLRRNAKDERVLFHYNGHGVPRPTVNGEIWVFNKSYTQYIPLSIYDLQVWMGSPSIYVYDCSNAGIILDTFKQFSTQRDHETTSSAISTGSSAVPTTSSQRCNGLPSPAPPPPAKNCIQLAACGPQAWDLALDLCLAQLNGILDEKKAFEHSPFFAEQLTAFQVWLNYGSEKRSPPEQLPIVLQVLLSQVHRLRALELLGRFLDLGPWAVSLALSVGIFPYVLKLLQSSARELRPLLVFIWAKILAVDSSCQADLVKDNGHKYFLTVLSDANMPAEHRTMAAFVLAKIVNNYQHGQEATLTGNLIAICLEQLNDPHHLLRQWLALCLGKVWTSFDAARWCGVRDSAHEKLYELLQDPIPEVRAAAVYSLGTFINNSFERTDHANSIDHGVAMTLAGVIHDASPIVRRELVVALSGLVVQFLVQFIAVAQQFMSEEKGRDNSAAGAAPESTLFASQAALGPAGMRRSASTRSLRNMLSPSHMTSAEGVLLGEGTATGGLKRVNSNSSVASLMGSSYGSVYMQIWRVLFQLTKDPISQVASLALTLMNHVRLQASVAGLPRQMSSMKLSSSSSSSHSAPSSPSNKPGSHMPQNAEASESEFTAPKNLPNRSSTLPRPSSHASLTSASSSTSDSGYTSQFSRSRKMFDKGPSLADDRIDEAEADSDVASKNHVVSTEFFAWCCRHFAQPVMRLPEESDPESDSHHEQHFRLLKSSRVRMLASEEQKRATHTRLDDQIFINRNPHVPNALCFHPYETHLAVADRDTVSVWEWEHGVRINCFSNKNPRHTRITALDFINAHDRALVLTGADDGSVRVWRNYFTEIPGSKLELVTAFQAVTDILHSSRNAGTVLCWEQNSGHLLASGDSRTIKVWDTQREIRVHDICTGAESCVTSLSCDSLDKSTVIASCADGSIRIFDQRMSDARVMTLRGHSGWVVKAQLVKYGSKSTQIVSGGVNGDVRFWDMRSTDCLDSMHTIHGLTTLDIHEHANLLACGSAQQCVGVYNFRGDNLSTIKYHEGFMGQRIGPISCLAFHPFRVKLAAGSTDTFVSVYSNPSQRVR